MNNKNKDILVTLCSYIKHLPLVTSAPKQLQIIHVLVYMLLVLCHGEDFKSSSKYNTCSIFLN